MTANSGFFESPQAAAVYKHKLIKTYEPAFVGKVGSTAAGGRVHVYDAYAGPGRYENLEPGSPELLVDTAVAMAGLRSVRTLFSDKEPDYCARLRKMLAEKGVDPASYTVLEGPVDDHVDRVLRDVGEDPLFVFLDPFGLTIPFDRVVHLLKSRDVSGRHSMHQPKTELLMNFSYEAVRRIAGVVRSDKDYAAKQGQLDALDRALGGDWWRPIALAEKDGWVSEILSGFANRVMKAVGNCGYITADVADSLSAQPVYELILFTRHPDGFWKMAEAMSLARKEWRQWLVDRKESEAGQTELRGLDWADNETAWIEEIAENIRTILSGTQGFTVQDKLGAVLGRTLGLARETHIRKALRLLKAEGVVAAVPTGSLQRAYIARK